MTLRLAVKADIGMVSALYKSVIGVNNSVWDENYPTAADAENDLERDNLFVLEKDGEIIGACSVEADGELKGLDFWKINDGTQREIARIVIAKEQQGKGYAKIMVRAFIDMLVERGCKSVHLLAAKSNPAAVKTYLALNFETVGECFAFGHDYYAMEYII
ncbi:MAG: GNAT family N-acetyltransferase [Ruminococcus sp.]|nr:GNAT family N-acetyltransferase [Ruminococcus sp.]